jgi:hypothetical protein
MRAHYFFMKFLRGLLIGFGCGLAAIFAVIVFAAAVYFVCFA